MSNVIVVIEPGSCSRNSAPSSLPGICRRPDEVAAVAALLMGPDGTFITGSDIDGGVTASYWYGELASK